jgi:predicted NBD/HSP70 family sugar kinase
MGVDHVGTRLRIALFDALGEIQLLLRREQRGFGNLPQVELQTAF